VEKMLFVVNGENEDGGGVLLPDVPFLLLIACSKEQRSFVEKKSFSFIHSLIHSFMLKLVLVLRVFIFIFFLQHYSSVL
jgi:hypothetical protein